MLGLGFVFTKAIYRSVPATASNVPFWLNTTDESGHRKGLNDLLSWPPCPTSHILQYISSPAVANMLTEGLNAMLLQPLSFALSF